MHFFFCPRVRRRVDGVVVGLQSAPPDAVAAMASEQLPRDRGGVQHHVRIYSRLASGNTLAGRAAGRFHGAVLPPVPRDAVEAVLGTKRNDHDRQPTTIARKGSLDTAP